MTESLGITYPIQCGTMPGIKTAELVAPAVIVPLYGTISGMAMMNIQQVGLDIREMSSFLRSGL